MWQSLIESRPPAKLSTKEFPVDRMSFSVTSIKDVRRGKKIILSGCSEDV